MNGNSAEDIIRQKINQSEATNDGASADTGELWMRLNIRLDKKPVKKIRLTYCYSAAAAALLAIITIIALLPKEKVIVQADKMNEKLMIKLPQQPAPIPAPSAITTNKQQQKTALITRRKHNRKKAISVQNKQMRITKNASAEMLVENNNNILPGKKDPRMYGLYVTPGIKGACSNTKVEDNLLCY